MALDELIKELTVPTYLGDGLYAQWDGYMVKLMANSHETPTDTVYLEPSVVANLNNWYNSIIERLQNDKY